MNKKIISVVTVCFNAEKDIEYTINSILNQDCNDYEYLIKDGLSSDDTIRIAEKYKDSFMAKNIPFRIISEKDNGLYDAMTKSAEYAEGEWIIYINAGDAFFDNHVLSHLGSEISDQYDVLYGDAVLLESGKYKLLKAKDVNCFKYCNPICHQASLTRTEVVRKYSFDQKYIIASDFDQFLRIYKAEEKRLKRLDFVFCVFLLGGISGNMIREREKEFNASRKKNGLKRFIFPQLQIQKNVTVETIRKIAIKILGPAFYSKNRGWFSDRYEAARYKHKKHD